MAKNIDTTVPSAALFSALLDFTASLSKEEAAKLPPEDSDDWFATAVEMYEAAHAEPKDEPAKGEKGTRKALHYTVLLLRKDAPAEVVGAGFGSIGRESADPREHSPARKLETSASIRVVRLAREGIEAMVLRVQTPMVASFYGIEIPKDEPVKAAAEATAEA